MAITNLISGETHIIFGQEIFEHLSKTIESESYSKVFILVDTNTSMHCLSHFLYELATEVSIEVIEIEAGEKNKNIETCVGVWDALTELGADRKSLLINLGGGVVTDMGGFVAATFKRGIDFINVPTTLLAMVDAAIGGKTGVDLGVLKNQIGVIKNPKAILIYDAFLQTLPQNQMRSGLAEMLKHGLIQDESYWNQLNHLADLNPENLLQLIYHSVQIKTKIVAEDPFEQGIRKALNFGHTIGHAIESYFLALDDSEPILHGEAVAAGMIIESYLSYKIELIDLSTFESIKNAINQYFEPLPLNVENISAIIPYLMHDKKNINQQIKFVLLEKIGQYCLDQKCDDNLILEAFEAYKK
uniref:3-dehydroquinate synthase n=1 Tax=Flavobacterium sp. TaxID=239 RepID=UPI0040491B1F